MLAPTLPANTLQGMMQLCCDALVDEGNTFYSQRVFDLFPQMATANSGWATHTAESLNVFGSMIGTDAANDSDYIEWTVFLPAGSYKVSALYYKNTSVGKADLTIDGGSVVDTLDTYGAALARNSLWTSAAFTVTEGSHTIRLTKNGKNASSTGYTIWVQHLFLVKQDSGSALASVANVPHTINVPIVFADSHSGWNTLIINTSQMFGTHVASAAAQNDEITFSFWAPKGDFTLALLHRTTTGAGIATVYIDGSSIGTIDTYGANAYNILDTSLTGTFASTGIHTIRFVMASKNASSSSYGGYLQHIQIRMTSITEPVSQDLAPQCVVVWPYKPSADSGSWTLACSGTFAYQYRRYSPNSQYNYIEFSDLVLAPGTYRVDCLAHTDITLAQGALYVDGSSSGLYWDLYSVSTAYNVLKSITGLTLSGYTSKTIKFKADARNAYGSGWYQIYIGPIRLLRTGA